VRIAAVILAGGRGERLGGANKALLTIGGERFIDRAISATSGCDPCLLAVGRDRFDAPAGLTQILDLESGYGGPLAGLAAAVAHLTGDSADLLLSLAVDTPLLPRDFMSRALPLLDAAPAAIATYGGQDYPTNALWRLRHLSDLPTRTLAGTAPRSLKRLAAEIGATRLDYTTLAHSDPFRNANTPEDLAFLRRAASQDRGG
jgi:molybdopterin-guanine dinucleotide biosynthesis protein A